MNEVKSKVFISFRAIGKGAPDISVWPPEKVYPFAKENPQFKIERISHVIMTETI